MHEQYYPQYNTRQGQYTSSVELDFLRERLRSCPADARFLDISGGGGRSSIFLGELGFEVVLTEIDRDALKFARNNKGSSSLEVVHTTPGVSGFCFRPQSFDAALCLQVPDLVENDPLFFDAVKTALRPGGILFVTVTNRASYKAVMRKWLGRGKPQLETSQFSQVNVYQASVAELIARANACGFQLQASVGFNWLPFAKGSNSKLITPAAKAERLLGLRRAAGISPWAMLHFALGE